MKYSIWLEPAQHDRLYLKRVIAGLAKTYDAPLFLPHITLYSGIRQFEAAQRAVRQCRAFPKFITTSTGIGYSDYLWKTLYVKIRLDANLAKIHTILKDALPTRYSFKPHVSLIYKKIPKKTKLQILLDLELKKSLEFDRITIIRSSNQVERWKRLFSMRLERRTLIRSSC
jgi:2'-5' RNA ligase